MKYVSKYLSRTENSCNSKLNDLKNDFDFKYTKPKETKHCRKITQEVKNAVKISLEDECATLTKMKRHKKLMERNIAKNLSVQSI